MVKFLVNRPVAVVMAFLAFVIIGVVTYLSLPVSLMPSVDIPKITVRLTADNISARELENTATAPVRRQLQQLPGLSDIHSETRDGSATISLGFDYGTDIDLAFIAANEKIDAAMNTLPRDMQRPKVIKASATDIPVIYLHITEKDTTTGDFLEMAHTADNTVRRRIEQLPEVAMVDVTGVPVRIMRITPYRSITEPLGITTAMIEEAVSSANNSPESMTVREGHYEYNVNITGRLRTPDDVADIRMRVADRIVRLGDIAEISIVETEPQGLSLYRGKRAVTLAVIKQGEENIDGLKHSLAETVESLSESYPQYEFSVSRDQTGLLDFTISNLVQNLVLGLILVFLVTALFMGDIRTPFVIGISIIVALVLTFLLFYVFRVSLNVISLSGLILAVGMMIDNSVIVTENITQWRRRGLHLIPACVKGSNEMITPLLSSSLTTVAVFLPLVFMSGIAGAIFADQAFSISAGLAMSYIVGIMLLPVLYRLFFTRRGKGGIREREWKETKQIDRRMERIYNKGIDFIFARKYLWLSVFILLIPAGASVAGMMRTERMPELDHAETMARIAWNENITVGENARRVAQATEICGDDIRESSAAVGVQDYMLDDGNSLSKSEAEIYLRSSSHREAGEAASAISGWLKKNHPGAELEFYPPENIFEKIFSSDEPQIEVRLSKRGDSREATPEAYARIRDTLAAVAGEPASAMALREQTVLESDNAEAALHNVDPAEADRVLRSAFREKGITILRSSSEYLPVAVAPAEGNLHEILATTMVSTRNSEAKSPAQVPLSQLVKIRHSEDFRDIHAGKNGEYLSVAFDGLDNPATSADAIERCLRDDGGWERELTGSLFSDSRLIKEMMVILLVSIALMYFILCAQFESFLQPLIVLMEIPLDITFALITLMIFGQTLNLMSAIGIIVTCGIVVNDSILKLDAINTLRKQGKLLLEAIHTAGTRRLRPIVMTSLTTILAMVPVLFTNDMGSRLQRPLAIAMIGSMVVGTLVSIFIIPLIYYVIYKRRRKNEPENIPA